MTSGLGTTCNAICIRRYTLGMDRMLLGLSVMESKSSVCFSFLLDCFRTSVLYEIVDRN